jgi:CxxC-x17-CxxC domain-containing protein
MSTQSSRESSDEPLALANKHLTCVECNQSFIFAATEQRFFHERGMQEPRRCLFCRQARRAEKEGRQFNKAPIVEFEAICAECKLPTCVPFEPRDNRKVYCRNCFAQRKRER